jgi:hypothetical protein
MDDGMPMPTLVSSMPMPNWEGVVALWEGVVALWEGVVALWEGVVAQW